MGGFYGKEGGARKLLVEDPQSLNRVPEDWRRGVESEPDPQLGDRYLLLRGEQALGEGALWSHYVIDKGCVAHLCFR